MQFALLYVNDAYDFKNKLMGRQSAGIGFVRAALNAELERIWCYASSRAAAQAFGQYVGQLSSKVPELRMILWDEPRKLAQAGTLYRPDPGIAEHAWRRQYHAQSRAYSLCGVTHTISSHGPMSVIANLSMTPLYPWDALICTSEVVRDSVEILLSSQERFAQDRLGVRRIVRPELPVIPLGVHCDDFVFSDKVRQRSRASLSIGEDDIVALFVGRLVFHGKGHPLPMFHGLEKAAQRSGKTIHLLLCGTYPSDAIRNAFLAEARQLAPSVRLVELNGAKAEDRVRAWSAADLFTSFSDNIQETFGLTPVEAMAAGLPAVVTDWNGYKETVRDGVDGFRIPTWAPPPGSGFDLADRFEHGLDNYDYHIGLVSQVVAVDVEAAAEAYTKLANSADLRRRMGQAGRARARAVFDWSVVFRQYMHLWEDLAERRRFHLPVEGENIPSRRPDRPDPFTLFRSYPTTTIGNATVVRRSDGADLALALERRRLASVSFAEQVVPAEGVIGRMLAALGEEPASVDALLRALPDLPPQSVVRGLLWLAKMGIVNLAR